MELINIGLKINNRTSFMRTDIQKSTLLHTLIYSSYMILTMKF